MQLLLQNIDMQHATRGGADRQATVARTASVAAEVVVCAARKRRSSATVSADFDAASRNIASASSGVGSARSGESQNVKIEEAPGVVAAAAARARDGGEVGSVRLMEAGSIVVCRE